MRLLVKRDPTNLIRTEGRAELDSDVPKILRKPRVVAPEEVDKIKDRYMDDLIIGGKEDYAEINEHFCGFSRVDSWFNKPLPGIWSGYRSVLVSNGNGGLYRLKGVSFNPKEPVVKEYENGSYEVFGGQPLQSARFEKRMSDRFNKVLANEGIVPIMTCRGYWHYPTKVKNKKLAASVVEIQGDTRVDELMFLLENYFAYRTNGLNKEKIAVNKQGFVLGNSIRGIYHDIGFAVGRLKRLMDKDNQTWSTDDERSNAHIGNIVLYNGGDDVKVGFVDFDASCDNRDYSKSKLRALQEREYNTIKNSANAGPISLRNINIGFLRYNKTVGLYPFLREGFVEGFEAGYEEEKRTGITTSEIAKGIDFARFLEIFEVLRDTCRLIPEPVRRVTEEIIRRRGGLDDLFYKNPYRNLYEYKKEKSLENYILKEDKYKSDPYNILDKNKKYQEIINNYI